MGLPSKASRPMRAISAAASSPLAANIKTPSTSSKFTKNLILLESAAERDAGEVSSIANEFSEKISKAKESVEKYSQSY